MFLMSSGLVFTKIEDDIARVYLNNQPANALNTEMLSKLEEKFDEVSENSGVKAIIITGEGRMFAAGADIKEFTNVFEDTGEGIEMAKNAQRIFRKIEQSKKPVIAAINGACLGGGMELAMSCHMRISADEALLGQPETNLGLIPGYGGTQRLARLVNIAKALELTIFGNNIKGKEAQEIGLVNLSVPLDELMETAESWASKIVKTKSSHTIEKLLDAVYRPFSGNNRDMDGFDNEAEIFGELFGTPDTQEGVNAFLEKRKAEFNK